MYWIDQLEKSQIYFGKCLLGVWPSTANVAVYLDLGLKPFLMQVLKIKLSYIQSAKSMGYNSLVKKCLEWHMKADESSWWTNLRCLVIKAGLSEKFIHDYSEESQKQKFKTIMIEQVSKLETLSAMPLPKKW